MASRPRQLFDYSMLRLLLLLARPVPRPVLLAMGRGLGWFAWRVIRYRRDVVLENLRHAFPDQNDPKIRDRVALGFFRNLGMTMMEFLAMPWLGTERMRELVEVEGREHLDAVAAEGNGALFVTGHFGNWELMAARVSADGYPVFAAVKTQSNARVDALQNSIRNSSGVSILRTDSGVKEMMKTLRGGGMVAMVVDQDAGGSGYFTDFLGRTASVFKGPAIFCRRMKAPILPVFIHRLPGGRHRIVIDPPMRADPAWDEETAVARLTERHVRRLEEVVRASPDHYFWVHRRWKTRPPA